MGCQGKILGSGAKRDLFSQEVQVQADFLQQLGATYLITIQAG
jgi:hypothetical protein